MTVTHTYAILEVDAATFADVMGRLLQAGYEHAIHDQDGRAVIDMHGIALRIEAPALKPIAGIVEDCPCCQLGCVRPCSLCHGTERVSPEAAQAWRDGDIDTAHRLESAD